MSPSLRHLTPADYRVMPWKNGLGSTTEIAVDPPGAGLDAFVWRVSIAELASSGPFSSFPGVERILVQTEGEPMELVHAGRGRRRLARLTPYRFDGAWATHGELVTPPARDFNVMVRRDAARAGAAVLELARGSAVRVAPADTQIIHVFRGNIAIRAGEAIDLCEGDTLIASGCAGLEILAAAGASIAFAIEIFSETT